jgi:putative Ca2+/H+ antiporter (TMEM165/GDT1 family)
VELLTIFLTTFIFIFVGELGDKTQIAAGTGTLANRGSMKIIFLSSALALTIVAGITVFAAGLIPTDIIPAIQRIGGGLLILYAAWLTYKMCNCDEETIKTSDSKSNYVLFFSHFMVVFMAEMGDKTQFATLAIAIENQSYLLTVFAASAAALVTVTGLTVWGVTHIPDRWTRYVQLIGLFLMLLYGLYMIFSP